MCPPLRVTNTVLVQMLHAPPFLDHFLTKRTLAHKQRKLDDAEDVWHMVESAIAPKQIVLIDVYSENYVGKI